MNLCNQGHNPIVYDEKSCPLCEAMAKVGVLSDAIEKIGKWADETEANCSVFCDQPKPHWTTVIK